MADKKNDQNKILEIIVLVTAVLNFLDAIIELLNK